MLELNKISVAYEHVPAIRDVSLTVGAGEIVALIGANGAGKTTTLRAIQGMIRPFSGSIHLENEDISRLAPHRAVARGISHCPQGRQVFYGMTVEENLKLGSLVVKNRTEKKKQLENVYELFPVLMERKQQLAGSLSGGEQQMLTIGRALMSRPKLLLLDEPSMGLAPRLVEDIFEMVIKINREGITMLLVEQNAYIALKTASRAYVMENGEIALSGDSAGLIENPHVRQSYLGI